MTLVVLFILSFGAFVVLADSEVRAEERDRSSPQNSQQPPPIKTVGTIEETATGRSPTESTLLKPLPSSEETQITPPAGPAPPTVPPPEATPQPEPAPQPEPPYHYEPGNPADATPQPKHAPTPQPEPRLEELTHNYEYYYGPGRLVDFEPRLEISADPALIVAHYYNNFPAPETLGLVPETSLVPTETVGSKETSEQASPKTPSSAVDPAVGPVKAAPGLLLPATPEENNPEENISPHPQPPAAAANVQPAPVTAGSPTNVAPANVALAKQQPSVTATYRKVPVSVPQSAPIYPRSDADTMPPREASSSKGVVNSFPVSVTKTFKGPAATNLRAPLTGVSSAEQPPAQQPPPPANDDSAQSPSEGSSTSIVPSSPLTSPEDSHFNQRSGGASVGASVNSGVSFAPLLLALLFSVMLLFRGDGRFWHLSWYLPKPTSVLLLPLERPG